MLRRTTQASVKVEERSRSIGRILVEHGILDSANAEEIQKFALRHGLRFGEAAVRMNHITQSDVEFAVGQQFNYPILTCGGDRGVDVEVVAGYNPQSKLIEPLRALRGLISLRWLNDPTRKVIAITSPGRAEGRSWLAANLATVYAQIGLRTLLIDADMRYPRQHKLFNISNEVGLSALVTGRASREVACRIHPQLRLFVLPAGLAPPNPNELLARPVFDLVLQRFAEQFDVVLLDTPAMAESADAQMLAVRAGAAIVMARHNETRQASLVAAVQSLKHAGVTLVGSIYNLY